MFENIVPGRRALGPKGDIRKTVLGVFEKNSEIQIFQKALKTVLFIAQQQNIAQRPFCIQNERKDILYPLK